MKKQVTIDVKNLSKTYPLYRNSMERLKEALHPFGKTYHTKHSALKDVSFQVQKGEVLGIVGRNGSGKSTLLKAITQIIQPTTGSIKVEGVVSAILELGAAFSREATGRENIHIRGTIMGLEKKEILRMEPEVIEFAGIGEYIDQPVKTYSSGMFARLAFALAIQTDPEILIVDEALSVGDSAFRHKCFNRIQGMMQANKTVLFVSHAEAQIMQFCSRAILLNEGELLMDGSPKQVLGAYNRICNASDEKRKLVVDEIRTQVKGGLLEEFVETEEEDSASPKEQEGPQDFSAMEGQSGKAKVVHPSMEGQEASEFFNPSLVPEEVTLYDSEGAEILNPRILDQEGQRVNILRYGGRYRYCYDVAFDQDLKEVHFGMMLKTMRGQGLAGGSTLKRGSLLSEAASGESYSVSWEFDCLLSDGDYFCNAGVSTVGEEGLFFHHRIIGGLMLRVLPAEDAFFTGLVGLNVDCRVEPLKRES